MNIKYTALAGAIASVLGVSSAQALAPTATADVQLIQMGSSALANVIEQVFIDYCQAGTLSEYRNATTLDLAGYNNTSSGGNNYRNYFCTMGSNASIPASIRGKNVLYNERLTGGSVFGVNPVGASIAQTYMNFTGCVAVSGTAPAANYACSGSGTNLTSAVPDAGISDVEPALFVPPNLPTNFPSPLTSSQLAGLTIKPLVQQVFMVVVGDGVKANVTNLTPAQLTSIFTSQYTDWSSVSSAVSGPIVACARTAGSGTQAAFNALFLNNPCSPSGGLSLGGTVIQNASTSAVVGCVNGVGKKSIGIVARADGPTATDNYAAINISGVAPTAANSANGSYPYQVVTTLQWRSNTPAGLKLDLLNGLAGILSTPSSLATVNNGLPAASINALGDNGFAPDNPYVATNPVAYRSAPLNTCAPTQMLFP
jgi:ABC-type phosphate transport system substrate-binding protein